MARKELLNLYDVPADFPSGGSELTAPQKAQIKMTYWVLLGSAFILLASGGAYVLAENGLAAYANDVRALCAEGGSDLVTTFCIKYANEVFSMTNNAAKEVFEFCKSFIPPIVTLVLGAHYVTRSAENAS